MKNLAALPGANLVTIKSQQCDCRSVGGNKLDFEARTPIVHMDNRADIACQQSRFRNRSLENYRIVLFHRITFLQDTL